MIKYTLSLLIILATALGVVGQVPVDSVQAESTKYTTFDPVVTRISRTLYSVGMIANAGNSELAPYYISSNNGGNITQQYSALLNASLVHSSDPDKRFAWAAGAEVWGGYASNAGYQRYKGDGQFETQKQHPARVWIQQAYVAAKYRSIFAIAGQAYKSSPIINGQLSSGDLVWSNNARPPVGLRAGFINFQNIPFTKGWVQIQGELATSVSWTTNGSRTTTTIIIISSPRTSGCTTRACTCAPTLTNPWCSPLAPNRPASLAAQLTITRTAK